MSELERSMPCGASEEWRTSRLGLRDSVASGVKCGLHGGKKTKEKISCMPQENTNHVLYANENVKLSSIPHVANFDVLHAISV
jgi:hypothetical protein